ncbi:MAG TPA: adenylate/guanylate cyclase domain-containing protein, partial [Acidimicrobiia bacterium]|nr:adenylate/guanylate cyclase domain-containing protein [Acidimicrobiia bacterium]
MGFTEGLGEPEIVTLLFTDLVGSTELLGQLGEQGAEALRRTHFDLIREAVAVHRGREVKTLGDGFMVVFASAVDALDCAVAIQRAVDSRRRNAGAVPLEVRIGLHLGEPIRHEGDFFGTPVVVASRLCSSAAGGEILTSEVLRSVVGARGDFVFRAVGPLALKGMSE